MKRRCATPSISPALTPRRRRADACIASGVSSRRARDRSMRVSCESPPIVSTCRRTSIAKRSPPLCARRSTRENPLTAAARVSAAALHILDDAPHIDAEIFALWLADLVLARRLGWAAPLPLLATTITHPSMRVATGRRPHARRSRLVFERRARLCARGARGLRVGRRVVAAFRTCCRASRQNCAPKRPRASSTCCLRMIAFRRRGRRRRRVFPIARRVVCSIGLLSLAPCANSPVAPIFGSTDCDMQRTLTCRR